MKKVISMMLVLCFGAVFLSLPALADSGDLCMYIQTGNSGKLHLRARPDSGSESLGLYRNGTRVTVEGFANSNWAAVTVNGKRGYMNLRYLTGTAPVQQISAVNRPAPSESTLLYVRTGNSGRLHLRAAPSQKADSLGLYPNGTPVLVTSRLNGWAFVNVNGAAGYMMLSFLTADPAAAAASGSVQSNDDSRYSAAAVPMYVSTGNAGRLHLREYASQEAGSLGLFANGTVVYAVHLGNGWSRVNVNGQSGFMMTRFLSATAAGVFSVPTQPPYSYSPSYPAPTAAPYRNGYYVPALTAAPAATAIPAPVYPSGIAMVRNPNSSFVYLRSSKNSDSTSNVLSQVPAGAVVQIVEMDRYWSKVIYNGQTGYMVTSYLK